jgi:hypothetical protein
MRGARRRLRRERLVWLRERRGKEKKRKKEE